MLTNTTGETGERNSCRTKYRDPTTASADSVVPEFPTAHDKRLTRVAEACFDVFGRPCSDSCGRATAPHKYVIIFLTLGRYVPEGV